MVYSEGALAQIIDFRSAHEEGVFDGPSSPKAHSLCRAVNRSIQHTGDEMTDKGGEHRMMIDLVALPPEITDIFFLLAAFECDDLSAFPNPAVGIFDGISGRQLSQYCLSSAGKTQAVVMCSLSRPDGSRWVVNGLGIPSAGNVRHYDPIRATITSRQEDYNRWERRETIVKLRAMVKTGRMTEASTSDYALFLWRVLRMPMTSFQLVVRWL